MKNTKTTKKTTVKKSSTDVTPKYEFTLVVDLTDMINFDYFTVVAAIGIAKNEYNAALEKEIFSKELKISRNEFLASKMGILSYEYNNHIEEAKNDVYSLYNKEHWYTKLWRKIKRIFRWK